MRIAYIMQDHGPTSGVWAKVQDQVREWRRQGHTAKVFILSVRASAYSDYEADICVCRHNGRWDQVRALRRLARQVQLWAPAIQYLRYEDLVLPSLPALARSSPTVLEINTDDIGQNLLSTRRRYWYHRLTRGSLLSAAAGAVFVSGETRSRPHFTRFFSARNSVVIGNGISLARYPVRPAPPAGPTRVVLIAKGVYEWLGIEKFLWLARQQDEWLFDVVGIEPGEVTSYDVPRNVRLHGLLPPDEYGPLLEKADIGVGVTSLYVIGMNETSSLKTREYMAHGFPFILASGDPDVPAKFPFCLRLPNSPENVYEHVDDIAAFTRAMKGRRIPRSLVEHIDTSNKESQRLQFLEECLRGGTRR